VSDVDDDEIDDTPGYTPNCPTCLHQLEPYLGDLFAGWLCPKCGRVVLLEELTNPSWFKRPGIDENAPRSDP